MPGDRNDDWNDDFIGDMREEADAQVLTRKERAVQEPPMYRVILLNDDFTPMEFVVWLLNTVFHRSPEDSTRIMMQVHTQGSGVCGIYPYDVARTKVFQTQSLAKQHGHPLQCSMEADGGHEPC